MHQPYDLIGIGFGPSNIALAIALEEKCQAGRRVDALFIEKLPQFAWHRGMLLEGAHMQISFLKDLVTLRNPTSRFTFINYLHEKHRLQDFVNLKTFFPSRHEFNDYLAWAAAQFEDRCVYAEEVFEVVPEWAGDEVVLLRVRSRDGAGNIRQRLTKNLVVSIGGTANVPDVFRAFRGDSRVFHSSSYLHDIVKNEGARKIAVVGAGQSAAEIFMDLHGRASAHQVDLIMRARSISPSDDSPFVNEIFNAEFVDHVYTRSPEERDELLREFWHTNYASPDLELIEEIFKVFYLQKVRGEARHRFLRRHEVQSARASSEGIHLALRDLNTGREHGERYDAVVLATGYAREQYKTLLEPLAPHLAGFSVTRDYRLRSADNFRPGIFLQGACEASHGLSDTLLSVMATRTAEIGDALLRADQTAAREPVGAVRALSR